MAFLPGGIIEVFRRLRTLLTHSKPALPQSKPGLAT
jgi:hypothetical protein